MKSTQIQKIFKLLLGISIIYNLKKKKDDETIIIIYPYTKKYVDIRKGYSIKAV